METIENLNQHKFALNNGAEIPALGFGTLLSDPNQTRTAVKAAVEVGFRHLDAAERYRNEAQIGAALKELFAEGTVRREDLFVTTKLWNNNHQPKRVRPALQASLDRLGLDAVDLYLVHTPFAFAPGDDQDPRDAHGAVVYDDAVTLEETWGAMETLVDEGLTRTIGLSDISVEGTRKIIDDARIKPAVVQVESHPYHPQWELHEFLETQGIVMLAFAPLGHALEPRLLDDPLIVDMARRFEKTPAQVLLAWGIQRGSAVLTSSANPQRIRENVDVTALTESAIREINERLDTRHRFNSVPDTGVPGFISR
ncbi:aldo/keto reductase [Mycobacterium montefiorense]|uniref:Dehydrogenase n=1 Tax=Mycobacterium montefiorense TaxID=154654 RepID=A0AA37PP18_9MYCO|nr:aldo/keto reductase [Mycobacterium montefiorense]GBG40667.1 dehydrogenase [Mycobacterium montefiorense]GKU33352.1 dehydrogenase [Mycobacterium montefiorense]GKU41720.1 dehydrogenase [Mycobacterium montefiorense]GKU44850.1 dehydrogenase [Mycobacterium montefiorense]GKU52144.1 dehydrogenase [Mycobacterium montefiorense]